MLAGSASPASVPRFHSGAVPTSALLKAPNLMISRVVQDELPAPRRIDATKALETDEAAVDGLTLDLGAVTTGTILAAGLFFGAGILV